MPKGRRDMTQTSSVNIAPADRSEIAAALKGRFLNLATQTGETNRGPTASASATRMVRVSSSG